MEDSQKDFKSRKLREDAPKFRDLKKETPVVTKWKEDVPEPVVWKVNQVKSVPEELSGFNAQKELGEKPAQEVKPVDTFADRIPQKEESPLPPLPVVPVISEPSLENEESKPVIEMPTSEPVSNAQPLKPASGNVVDKILGRLRESVGFLRRNPELAGEDKPSESEIYRREHPLPPMPAGVEPPGQIRSEQVPVSRPQGVPVNEMLKKMSENNEPKT
ncbi:MAG TPA: hypothetical protein VLE44_03485 [Candidatus Saccharimonadales bacterium]|nr:hypothetical protein [Candidatus Saccharimonadales bacterium]